MNNRRLQYMIYLVKKHTYIIKLYVKHVSITICENVFSYNVQAEYNTFENLKF